MSNNLSKLIITDKDTRKLLWRDDSRQLRREGKYTRLVYKDREIFLSPQPLRCLLWLRFGFNNKSIAEKLDRSEETVRDHVKNLRRKFGGISRDQSVEVAQSKDMQYLNNLKI